MSWLLSILTAVLLFLAAWIVIPAPTMALLPLGVGAPEVSPFLLAAAAMLGVIAVRRAFAGRNRITAALALIATVLCALPLAQLPAVVRRFDRAMSAAGLPPDSHAHAGRRARCSRCGDLALGIDPGDARVVRGIPFAAPSDHPLTLDVYTPLSAGRFPVLVQIYGGSWQRGAPANDEMFARYFAAHGYVVAAIDYRHAPRWQWPAQIEDVRAALAWLREHAAEHGGDATRTALLGRSAGAQLALMAAYLEGTPRVAAVVSYYGPTDLAEGWRVPPRPDPLDVRAVLEAYLGGTPDAVPDRYRDASPVTYASATLPPTLLIYGARDHIVEARFGRALDDRLRRAGATSVLLEIPWAEHAFDALPSGLSAQLALFYTERFLAATLSARQRQ